ncbi:MAG: hypothetical protein RIQ81_648 [Pseudomonadota bacterium]|jgi:long-chain fatty acid transport protein
MKDKDFQVPLLLKVEPMRKFFPNPRLVAVTSSIAASLFLARAARADIYHYSNVLVGERAIGIGGAYTAVADDASGVYYNPAGLAFAQSNDISGSGNAFYNKTTEYSKVIANQSYTETAGGTFAPFLGVLNKLDRFVPGLVGAFAMYTSDTELLDQNDRWPTVYIGQSGTKFTSIQGFHRTVQLRTATSHIAAGVGYRLSGRMSAGLAVRYTSISELSQDFQQSDSVVEETASGTAVATTVVKQYSNNRTSLEAKGFEPTFGFQMALGQSLSLGLSIRKGSWITQEKTVASDRLATQQTSDSGVTGNTGALVVETASSSDAKSSNPLGTIPGEVRVGVAWFASPKLMASGDISYVDAAAGSKGAGRRNAVLNYAAGAEFYVTPSVAMRGGFFTNNDARAEVTSSKYTGGTNINYKGGSLFAAYIQPNSQISVGAVIQSGTGQSQKVEGVNDPVDVTSSLTTFAFAATTSL